MDTIRARGESAPAAGPPPLPPAMPAPPVGGAPSQGPAARQSRRQRLALPVALGATAACGCAAVALVNPSDGGLPVCWSQAVFGVDCPFCGGLRATNALLRGQFGQAIDHNVILAVVVPITALMWVWWMSRQWRGATEPAVRVPKWLGITALVLLVGFAVVRNLGGPAWARWLHSDLYSG